MIISMLVSWVALSVGFWAASALLPGMRIRGGLVNTFMASALFGLLMYFLGTFLFVLIGIGTFGLGFLFSFIARLIVGSILLIATDKLTNRLSIDGFRTAFVAALIVSVVGGGAEYLIEEFVL